MTLDKMMLNEEMTVKKVTGKDSIKRRFLDLGFIPGIKVKCVLISPFKDPKAYKVSGNIIAIRNNDAKYIEGEL